MSFRTLTFKFEIVFKTMMSLFFKIGNLRKTKFMCAEKQNFFLSLFTLTFHFEKNDGTFFLNLRRQNTRYSM